ncbi:MAG: amidohydrolase family protein, partial [Rhodobacteraceae bacterium]|nr:amidohydrolase family protein [Paracoccaceae bacterium]
PVFLPEQCLSLDECVEGYTINAARAGWREATTGSLAPGKWADFIVIDRDLWATDPRDIGDTEVLATYLSGRVVHGGI